MKKVSMAILTAVILLVAVVGLTTIMVRVPKEEVKVGAEVTTWVGAKYVGSAECRECHERIYAGWKETLHANIVKDAKANPYAILGDFRPGVKVKAKEPYDLPFKKEDVVFTHGSDRKQRYITKINDDYFVFPAQYNLNTREWTPYDADKWKPGGDKNPYLKNCGGCHFTGFDPEKKTWAELAVGCEVCHGPGGNHINATEKISTIVNPTRLTSLAAAQVCGQCHNRGKSADGKYDYPVGFMPGANIHLYFDSKPGTWPDNATSRSHRQQYIDWLKSKHAAGGVACHDCHTVHSNDYTFQLKAPSSKLCVDCHTVKTTDKHMEPCKTTLCTGCHMPQMIRTTGDERESLHTMEVILPEVSVKIGGKGLAGVAKMPNSCNLCHAHEKDDPEKLQNAWNEGRLVTALRKEVVEKK